MSEQPLPAARPDDQPIEAGEGGGSSGPSSPSGAGAVAKPGGAAPGSDWMSRE